MLHRYECSDESRGVVVCARNAQQSKMSNAMTEQSGNITGYMTKLKLLCTIRLVYI